MSALEPRFLRFVRTRGLIRNNDRILVAASGGVDSMVLLHLIKSTAHVLHVRVHAAHFDHAMRPGSEADAQWLASECARIEVPLITGRASTHLRSEAQARSARYDFLLDAARQTGSTRIATAHHADDQIETVVLRLLRGTGMRGLAGIPVRRGPFIRPLLRFHKSELLSYAAMHGIPFREDPTNAQLHFARNRVRTIVLPALNAARPELGAAILQLTRHAARSEKAWRRMLAEAKKAAVISRETNAVELARGVLLEYHPELRARVLRDELRRLGAVPGRTQTRHILEFCDNADSGNVLTVAAGIRIERAFDRIRILTAPATTAPDRMVAITGPAGNQIVRVGGRTFEVAWKIGAPQANAETFEVSAVDLQLVFRGWLAGDRIRMPYGTKKLKKLFAERRVPAADRARIPVLTDSHGRVLWVVGVARSIDAPPTPSGAVLNITVRNAESC